MTIDQFPTLRGQRAEDREHPGTLCTIIAAWDDNAVVEYDDERDVPVSVQCYDILDEPLFVTASPRFRLIGEAWDVTFDEDGAYILEREKERRRG